MSAGPPEPSIRLAEPADLPVLTALATATYVAAFGASFPPGELAPYLELHLSPAAFARSIAGEPVLLAEAAGAPAGYLHAGPAATGEPAPWEIHRLHVAAPWQSHGLGGRLLAAALAARPGPVQLDVWVHNHGARRFYERHGFRVVGTRGYVFPSGAPGDDDLVMLRAG
jgi:ribosomal protein S18 acetylase RimI-like enzyme